MRKIKAIIADSDGTLVDTRYLIRHGQYEASVDHLAEVSAIGITHGFSTESELTASGAMNVVDSLEKVMQYIDQ
jgi:phosphoglycolate phosphatase-like HAD superfamily hydrolase